MEKLDLFLRNEIVAINNHIKMILHSDNKRMQEIIDWVLQAPGKQLRPKLMCLCSEFGKKKSDITKQAAMLEILHMASLIHDDVVDDADIRRGIYSVQKKFGKHMAVYAGDYMIFCIINEAIREKSYNNIKKYTGFYEVIGKMCYGELGQEEVMFNTEVTEDMYIENITGKTANLFQTACSLGAVINGATKKVIYALEEYGKNLGLLFQIRDDLLDYTSDEKKIGKPILQDYFNGIYTLPIIYTFEKTEYKTKFLKFSEKIKTEGLTNINKKQMLDIIYMANGIERTKNKAKEFYEKACFAIKDLEEIDEKDYLLYILEKIYVSILLDN